MAGPDNSLHSQPSNAIPRTLTKGALTVADLDLIEINKAFAAVAIQSTRDLGVGADWVNKTAARSRPATRSGRPGPASPCIWCTSCRGAAAVSGPPGCAGAVARARALILRVPAPAV